MGTKKVELEFEYEYWSADGPILLTVDAKYFFCKGNRDQPDDWYVVLKSATDAENKDYLLKLPKAEINTLEEIASEYGSRLL